MKKKQANFKDIWEMADAADLSPLFPQNEPCEDLKESEDPNAGKHVQVKTTVNRHHMRRVSSEAAVEKILDWHFEQGNSYHIISHGDIDSLSYLRCIVKQQKLRFALVSTWVMASEDISEIRSWIERGYIGRCDFYVGEIFKASYFKQYEELIALCKKFGGRVAICRNHSKVILAFGERFDAVVESSANVNHNPRIEQACITVDTELAQWYKDFFDGIISFERNFDDVQPWRPQAED